ncbi:MAG: hypothetical protein H0W15_11830 [Gemmatimonadales bacterium]|nr:hypothetical protein [Gemmatimonadales bacterium]
MTNERTIELLAYMTDGAHALVGRKRGELVRKANKLDDLDDTTDTIVVTVAQDIWSVNSSFFLGMFGNSIRKLGEAAFRRRYRFVGKGTAELVDDGVRTALRRSSPLPTVDETA